MQTLTRVTPLFRLSTLALLVACASQAGAYELYADEDTHLNADLEAVFGVFHSPVSYTHLDVYKRQFLRPFRKTREDP